MKIPSDVVRKIKAGECDDHWVITKSRDIFAKTITVVDAEHMSVATTDGKNLIIGWSDIKKIVG